ncbi:MAG: DUF2231 domain-containing protein, partial [Nocardioidaceae bacterium]
MGPVEVNGLPTHVLIVHVVVVLIPAAALCVVLSAWWPRARRWLGVLTPIAALAGLAVVPVATNAGEWLAERLGETPLIERHEELGKLMLWWAIGLFVVAVVQWAWHRWYAGAARSGTDAPAGPVRARTTVVSVLIGLVATGVAVGATAHVIRVGESGSRAVWEGSYSSE